MNANTTTGLSGDQIYAFTDALWRHVCADPDAPLATDPEIKQAIGGAADLAALADRVDALSPADRHLFAWSVDEVQVRSKLWLIDQLIRRRDLAGASLTVLGAWYGILPLLMTWRLARPPERMVCVDISAEACALGERVVGALDRRIAYRVADAMDLDYPALAAEESSVLVNTICEHLADAPGWWARVPAGQFVVLQSNNYDACRDHINCVHSLAEMKAQTPLAELAFEGVLPLPIFDRYMLIGRR